MTKETIMTNSENKKGAAWCGSVSVCLLSWLPVALFFFLVSWLIGGNEFMESIGGYYTLIVILCGIAAGLALKYIPRRGADVSAQH
jgi:hypothetical protein